MARTPVLLLGLVIPTVLLLTGPGDTPNRERRSHQHSGKSTWEENTWYRAMNWTARGKNKSNCYICSQMPHHTGHQPIFTPWGVNKTEMMCLFGESMLRGMGTNFTANMTKWFPDCVITRGNWLDPSNFMEHTNKTLSVGIAPLRGHKPSPICLQRNCTNGYNHSLPGQMFCNEKVDLQANSSAVMVEGDPPVPFLATYNTTWWFMGTNMTTYNGTQRFTLRTPTQTPPGMMWQCGGMLYWYLPWNWCGTCTLVHLQIKKRDTEEKKPTISEVRCFLMTMFPAYGTTNLATQVNQLRFSLKNLTDAVLELEGGVCEMVGNHCCTYIPDHKGNYTLIRDKLNTIKKNIMSHQDKWSDFDTSSWFFSGSWRSILTRVCMIILAIFVLLCIITSCIIPCVRTMMTKMLTTALIQYTAVQIEEDSEEDEKDGNAFV
uniref:Envelope glycoprotein n=1 Tax=Amphiprion ocellaris TaxID=80972 RepID=A0A3Q1C358_AMPOC